jgi:hypothetical protein
MVDHDKFLFFMSLFEPDKRYSYRELERLGWKKNKKHDPGKNIDYSTIVRYCARAKADKKVTVRRYGRQMGVRLV